MGLTFGATAAPAALPTPSPPCKRARGSPTTLSSGDAATATDTNSKISRTTGSKGRPTDDPLPKTAALMQEFENAGPENPRFFGTSARRRH